jgi:hypothetical protein
MKLNSDAATTIFNPSSTPVSFDRGPFEIRVPNSTVIIPKPLSYEFRVAEYMDKGAVTKVGLQVRVWEHNHKGEGAVLKEWKDVERVQLPLVV